MRDVGVMGKLFRILPPRTSVRLVLCAFVAGGLPGCFREPVAPDDLYVRDVSGDVFDTAAVRGEYLPLRNRRTGFEYKCSECHTDFKSPTRQQDMQGEHKAIYDAFDHGMNTRCINCHHLEDRDSFVNHDGSPIPASEPALLCAKCHGPTYRDWETGIHGRQNGHWDAKFGARPKLLCVQCHDPHHPKFAPMAPEPPPPYSRFAKTPTHDDNPEPVSPVEEGTHP